MTEETVFKHLDTKVCGPHCVAKDNGSGHYVNIGHCKDCHIEFDLPIEDRPAHGPGKIVKK